MKSGRRVRAGAGLAFVLGVGVGVGAAGEAPGAPSVAERIAFYSARVGGPGTYALRARLGLAYLDLARETGDGRYHVEAERDLRASLGVQRSFEALYGLAALDSARHRFRAALAYAEDAAAAAPGSPEALGLLFEIQLALGQAETARGTLEKMLAGGARFAALARQAALAEYGGAHDQALVAIEQACSRGEQEGLPMASRAWCEVRRGELLLRGRCDPQAAERAYGAALEALPGYFLAREHLARLRAAQGQLGEARALYAALLRDIPGDLHDRLALADLDEREGRPGRARRERRRLCSELRREIESGVREHVREYALLLLDSGAPSATAEALSLARAEWRERHDWISADTLAWALHRSGLTVEAERMADAVLATGTRNARAALHAAEIASAVGREVEARALVDELLACPIALEPGQREHAERLRLKAGQPTEPGWAPDGP